MRKPIIALLLVSGLISSPLLADEIKLQDNPPSQYVVVKGDTLWAISGRFLKEPWRWPEIWKMNREQIKNPHWIYPGDLIVLDTSGASPELRLVKNARAGGAETTDRLSPRVRAEALDKDAIPSIPPSAIGPFLSQPLVIEEGALDGAPYIVGAEEERVVMGRGDKAYVAGIGNATAQDWKIFRPGKPLTDPETDKILGYEAEYLGEARTVQGGDVQTVEITKSVKEINLEDRLVAAAEDSVFRYVPHAPERPVAGRVIAAYGSVSDVGQYATVVLNKGKQDGLEEGHVLAVYRKGQTVRGKTWSDVKVDCLKPGAKASSDQPFDAREGYKASCRSSKDEDMSLPDARTGLVFVYRVFDRAAYALVMQTNRPVYLLDVVRNP